MNMACEVGDQNLAPSLNVKGVSFDRVVP